MAISEMNWSTGSRKRASMSSSSKSSSLSSFYKDRNGLGCPRRRTEEEQMYLLVVSSSRLKESSDNEEDREAEGVESAELHGKTGAC